MARVPRPFNQDLADTICERLAKGESLRKICDHPDMPSHSTVLDWVLANEAFSDQYARARSKQADVLAEQVVDIADEDPVMLFKNIDGVDVASVDGNAIAHQRLRIDARKWFAGKVAPKKYGDKLDLEHKGEVSHNVTVVSYAHDILNPPA